MKTTKSAFKFKGGVHPDYNKDLARGKAIETMPVPAELVVSMSQHLGAPAKCVVKAGDYVAKGQLLGEKNGFISVPVYASAAGLVKSVEPRLGPAGGKAPAVVIDTTAPAPEGFDASERTLPPLDWKTATKEELLARVNDAGICGMGGAGFPTCVKLRPASAASTSSSTERSASRTSAPTTTSCSSARTASASAWRSCARCSACPPSGSRSRRTSRTR